VPETPPCTLVVSVAPETPPVVSCLVVVIRSDSTARSFQRVLRSIHFIPPRRLLHDRFVAVPVEANCVPFLCCSCPRFLRAYSLFVLFAVVYVPLPEAAPVSVVLVVVLKAGAGDSSVHSSCCLDIVGAGEYSARSLFHSFDASSIEGFIVDLFAGGNSRLLVFQCRVPLL
jgi:hypothetical protein